jgi:hypothetical protein
MYMGACTRLRYFGALVLDVACWHNAILLLAALATAVTSIPRLVPKG